MNHIFISPHLDDAILSCTDYIQSLRKKDTITILTIFTQFGDGKYLSRHARRYLNSSGQPTTTDFRNLRLKEDQKAAEKLNARYIHIDKFIDAGFRTKPDFSSTTEKILAYIGFGSYFLYPTHGHRHLFSGKVHSQDKSLPKQIAAAIQPHVNAKDILYFPISIGDHVDHILVNQSSTYFTNKKYFWLDYPYVLYPENQSTLKAKLMPYRLKTSPTLDPHKRTIISIYASQDSCRISKHDINQYQEQIYSKHS